MRIGENLSELKRAFKLVVKDLTYIYPNFILEPQIMSQPGREIYFEFPWIFHDESWDEKWSSDDFPAGETQTQAWLRRRALRQESWWEGARSDVVPFLKDEIMKRWPWGFMIYRTVYTPESDRHWLSAVEAIQKNLFRSINFSLEHLRNQHEKPYRLLREGYRSIVVDDKDRFDGATKDQVRQHFKEWVDKENGFFGVRFRFCLLVDEEALQSIIRTPVQALCSTRTPNWPEKNGAWVSVIDPKYNRARRYSDPSYTGYLRVHLNLLLRLSSVSNVLSLPRLCLRIEGPDNIPWFDDEI